MVFRPSSPPPSCPPLPRLPYPGSPGIGETGLRDQASARIGGGPIRALSSSPDSAPGEIPGNARPEENRGAFGGAGGLGVPGPWTGGRPEGATFAPCGHRLSPQAGGPAAVRRSLPRRPKPSRNFIPAGDAGRRAAAHPRLAGACPNGAPSLFRSPPPSCRPLAPLAGGVEGARAPSSGLRPRPRPIPGGFAGDSRGSNPDPASPPQRRFPSPALRRDPGKPRVEPGPTGCGFPGFALQGRSRICGGIPRKRPGWVEGNRPGPGAIPRAEMAAPSPRAAGFPRPPPPSSSGLAMRTAIEYRY
jgi:hypothetical protein